MTKIFSIDKNDLNSRKYSSFYDEESIVTENKFEIDFEKDFNEMSFDRFFFKGLLKGVFLNIFSIFCLMTNHKKSYRMGIIFGLCTGFLCLFIFSFLFFKKFIINK